jgi:tryptophan 2,3-dioxygenase
MIIANPIYDVVFKYLLEDVEIARELLTHDSYLIQVRKLAKAARNKLERVWK